MAFLLLFPILLAAIGCALAFQMARYDRRSEAGHHATAYVPEPRTAKAAITPDELIDLHLELARLKDLRSAVGSGTEVLRLR
ncbi:MAG TPA: hypothetical protein VET65_14190 [Candidatus Limnocylindrales bacterium]|nr:hypothetical protein [Candidatus Limnocylindrales bacterium]